MVSLTENQSKKSPKKMEKIITDFCFSRLCRFFEISKYLKNIFFFPPFTTRTDQCYGRI